VGSAGAEISSHVISDKASSMTTETDEPVTRWIEELRQGDQSAARQVWQHFVGRLCTATRGELRPETRRVYDEEDAAQSAFNSLCAGVAAGRFPDLDNRHSLWRLLLVIASRKVAHRHRYDQQQCRDVRRNLEESIFCLPTDSAVGRLGQLPSREPTPEYQAEFVETSIALFEVLDEPELQRIAELRIEGYGDTEIAERLDCSRQAVQRKVERIRRRWLRIQCQLEN
jgi:RNA polymerase sigma factor (sigma-70 family)